MHVHTAGYHRELRQRRKQIKLPFGAQRLLAIFEGVEGGFAIGAGIIVGLVAIQTDRHLVLISAAISLLVSSFSAAAIKYAAEHQIDEADGREKKNVVQHYFMPALYDFVACLIASVLVLLPVHFVADIYLAATLSVLVTLGVLFVAGVWRGYLMRRHHKLRDGIELMIVGVLIIIIGGLSGILLGSLTSI